MPFVQMENISHFLKACKNPPLGLQSHDIFQTVDLYESKDPAQVLQCIEAFSRRTSAVQPARFPKAIGGKKATTVTPQGTGSGSQPSMSRDRGASNVSETSSAAGGRTSPFKNGSASPSGGASSWARKTDIGSTAPAWNIAQYGWTGGASQGNQGIMFGGRRQITTPAPHVPSQAEKERRRREEEAEAERLRLEKEEAERQLRLEREAEEERAQAEEARIWEKETKKRKEEERKAAEEEKRQWEDEERRWKEEEEIRVREEKEAEARTDKDRQRRRAGSDARLRGQFLSQYHAEQRQSSAESTRIKELERQLEEAKEREQRYEQERQERLALDAKKASDPPPAEPAKPTTPAEARAPSADEDSWLQSERDYLRQEWTRNQEQPRQPPRPLPIPQAQPAAPEQPSISPRPLPDPTTYKPPTPARPDPIAPPAPTAPISAPATESPQPPPQAAARPSRPPPSSASPNPTSKPPSFAGRGGPSSLLEREMERERQRQREWEEAQQQTRAAATQGRVDTAAGSAPGQSWDVNTYGYTGGDSLNKSGSGVYAGRRQILGPRPLEKKQG